MDIDTVTAVCEPGSGTEQESDRTAVFGAFALGIVIGVSAGMLLAPDSGRGTRARIRRSAAEASSHTRALVHDRRERLHAFIRRHGVVGLLRHRTVLAAREVATS